MNNDYLDLWIDNGCHGDDQVTSCWSDDNNRLIAVVADGVGGAPGGRIASAYACYFAEQWAKENANAFRSLDGKKVIIAILDFVSNKMKEVLTGSHLSEGNWKRVVQYYLDISAARGWPERAGRMQELEKEVENSGGESPATTFGLALCDFDQDECSTVFVGDPVCYLIGHFEVVPHSPPKGSTPELISYFSSKGLAGEPDFAWRDLSKYTSLVLGSDGSELFHNRFGYAPFKTNVDNSAVGKTAQNWWDQLEKPLGDDFSLITIRLTPGSNQAISESSPATVAGQPPLAPLSPDPTCPGREKRQNSPDLKPSFFSIPGVKTLIFGLVIGLLLGFIIFSVPQAPVDNNKPAVHSAVPSSPGIVPGDNKSADSAIAAPPAKQAGTDPHPDLAAPLLKVE
jgi:hypothetical protein